MKMNFALLKRKILDDKVLSLIVTDELLSNDFYVFAKETKPSTVVTF